MTDPELAAAAARVDAVMEDLQRHLASRMTHAFQIVALGPPVFTARCTCAWWHLAWDADELTRRGFETIEDVEHAARQEHALHADARRVLEMHAARDPSFYG